MYKDALRLRIDKMLVSFSVNMDPSNYRRLYRDKAFRENLNLPSAEGRSANAAGVSAGHASVNIGQAGINSSTPSSMNSSAIGHHRVRQSVQLLGPDFVLLTQ